MMEVHQHSHTPRKKWTHYFWEFLMLFLAVFCGFLAENQREHMIEKKREKDYIRLFIEDLQIDTGIINSQLPKIDRAIKGLDTLIAETYAYLEGTPDTRKMYYTYHRYCRNRNTLTLSQRAVNQLKNSGNMRLIHDKEALILIMGVEVDFTDLGEHAKMVVDRMEGASQFGTRIFDFREYQKANTGPDGGIIDNEDGFLRLNYQPDLNTKDPVYLKEFIARVGYYRNTLYSHAERLQGILSRFEWSTKKLKENYRL